MKITILCACGEVLELYGGREPEAVPETCRYWGFEMRDGAWKCWRCLGLPTPPGVKDLARMREIEELKSEPPEEQTDPEDFLRSLEGLPPVDREALRKASFLTPDQAVKFYKRFLIRFKHLLGDPSELPENIKAILDDLEAEEGLGGPWEGPEGPQPEGGPP